MSDGPHRSLPMRPPWKALAERADNRNFTPEQVADTVCPALASDWRAEVSPILLSRVAAALGTGDQGILFIDDTQLLSVLRSQCGSPMEAALIDAASDSIADGLTGHEALSQAIADTLADRVLRDIRSVEEHYLRKAAQSRAARVRDRLEGAATHAPINELAQAIARGTATARQFQPAKHDGVDEGVPL